MVVGLPGYKYLEALCPSFWKVLTLQKKVQTPIKTRVIQGFQVNYKLEVLAHLKNISQIKSFPQIEVKTEHV